VDYISQIADRLTLNAKGPDSVGAFFICSWVLRYQNAQAGSLGVRHHAAGTPSGRWPLLEGERRSRVLIDQFLDVGVQRQALEHADVGATGIEPPRLSWRPVSVSQAGIA
jgi:hypothetical protein